MCSEHKHKGHGDAYRLLTPQVMREVGVKRRWNRHDVPDRDDLVDEDTVGFDADCRHGCNGVCVVTGSEKCTFTCHLGLSPDDPWLAKYTEATR
jgi:hypothetical protein